MPLKRSHSRADHISAFDQIYDVDRERRRLSYKAESLIRDQEMLLCFDVVVHFIDNPLAAAFIYPVDWVALDLPTYPKVIKTPMDLSTIRQKLLDNEIQNHEQFAKLVKLIFKNALKFNEPGSEISNLAEELLDEFETNYNELRVLVSGIKSSNTNQMTDNETETDSSNNIEIQALEQQLTLIESRIEQTKQSIIEVKQQQEEQAKEVVEERLKARLPVNRIRRLKVIPPRQPLTYSEKEELCRRIEESLDRSAVPGLLQVISTSEVSGDEVEVDIDKLDDDTLLKVQAYVDHVTRKPSRRTTTNYETDGDYSDKALRRSANKAKQAIERAEQATRQRLAAGENQLRNARMPKNQR